MYTDDEICLMFKNADTNLNKMKLMQELTMLDKKEIIKILEKYGYKLTGYAKTNNKCKKIFTREEFTTLYKLGLSDSKMGKRTGLSESVIRHWRMSFDLLPNCRKRAD